MIRPKLNLLLILAALLFSCSGLPKADKAVLEKNLTPQGENGQEIVLDTAASYIRFIGHGVGHNHAGRFKIKDGHFFIHESSITGGSFLIDINSMNLEEQSKAVQQKLRPHLLSADFFDVQKFPVARFDIVKAEPYNSGSVVKANYLITGNLQMKDVTRTISFPAQVSITDEPISGKADFNINRTWWNMSYGNDHSLGNKFISETVNVQLEIRARKKGSDQQEGRSTQP